MHALAGARASLSGASSCPGVALLMLCLSCPVQSVHALGDRGPSPIQPNATVVLVGAFYIRGANRGLESVNEMMTKCR